MRLSRQRRRARRRRSGSRRLQKGGISEISATNSSAVLASCTEAEARLNGGFESDDEGDGGEEERVVELTVEVNGLSCSAACSATEGDAHAFEELTLRFDLAHSSSNSTAEAATPSPQASANASLPERQRRIGMSPPTPEMLNTLQSLKRTADPDSDESGAAAYATDNGMYQLPVRKYSSLRSPDGEDHSNGGSGSVFYGVPRLPSDRLAPPLSAGSRLQSTPDFGAGRLRKVSHLSVTSDASTWHPADRRAPDSGLGRFRQMSHLSVTSETAGAIPGRQPDRKVSTQRAVRLDYQFVTSSAKHSLNKVGQRSLAQLEDLAHIGATEQGTNFKRSYVSLYSPMRPMFLALKLFGVFHTRQRGGRATPKFTNSYVYSGLVLLAAWFNALRFCFVYDWGEERFDSLLFFRLTQHAIYIQTAVATSVMFRASGKFPRFFKACHEFMGRRHSLAYRSALSRRTKATLVLGCLVMLTELATYLSWVIRADSEFLRAFLRPYTFLVPWTDASRALLTCLAFAFNVLSAAAWIFPALLFCNFAWIFEREFRHLAHRLRLACTNDNIFVGDIEKFRVESWRIGKLVARLDELFNFYVFVLFLTDVLSVCLILYNLVVGQYPNDGSAIQAWFWLLSALLRLFGVTASAARVHQAACSPLNIIQNMNLKDYAVNPAKIGQLMIFLNKLTIGNIGFTAWNLFTLSRTSTLTIAAMILSYTLLFVKLGASYGQDDRLKPRVTTGTTMGLDATFSPSGTW